MAFKLNGSVSTIYRHFIFWPRRKVRGVIELAGVQKKDVYIKAVDGTLMQGWLFQRQQAPYIVLINHGNAGNLDDIKWLIENLLESENVSVLAYDYRGYGNSVGNTVGMPNVESVVEDGFSAYDYVRDGLGYAPEAIILYGQSIGGGVTCQVMDRRPCLGVILQSGFSSLRKVVSHHVPFLAHSSLVPDALDNRAVLAGKEHPPLLFIHGTADFTVPHWNSEEMFASAQGRKELVLCEGACHKLFPAARYKHKDATFRFIDSLKP